MAKKKQKDVELPEDLLEAIDEAAADLAAETNLTKAQAREAIEARVKAKAISAEEAADEIEDEEDEEDEDEPKKGKKGKKDEKPSDDADDDEDDDDDDEEDEDEVAAKRKTKRTRDEKPPRSHWSERKLFGGSK